MTNNDLIDLIDETIENETERLWAEKGIPEGLVNRLTGLPPTPAEWEYIKARAQQILDSPYAAPELMAWAMDISPTGIIAPFEGQLWKKLSR